MSASVEVRELPEEPREVVESRRGEGVEASRDDHGGVQPDGTGRHCAVPQSEYLLTVPPRADDLRSVSPTTQPSSQHHSRG